MELEIRLAKSLSTKQLDVQSPFFSMTELWQVTTVQVEPEELKHKVCGR